MSRAKLRTCASNRRHFKKNSRGMRTPIVKEHRGCITDPMNFFPQEIAIIRTARLPELHLHLHCNWYIDHIEKLVPSISDWYKDLHCTRSDYHGGDFQGMQAYFTCTRVHIHSFIAHECIFKVCRHPKHSEMNSRAISRKFLVVTGGLQKS